MPSVCNIEEPQPPTERTCKDLYGEARLTQLHQQHHGMLMLPLLITSDVSEYLVMKMCVLWEISHEGGHLGAWL